MRTYELDKCINLLKYTEGDTRSKINVLVSFETNFQEVFIDPFRRELALNLLAKITDQEKKDLIAFYIDEIDRSIVILNLYENIIIDNYSFPYYYKYEDEPNEESVTEVRAHYLYSQLFKAIQDYCNLYQIPFLEICRNRFFNLNAIDITTTENWEKWKQEVENLIENKKEIFKNTDPIISANSEIISSENQTSEIIEPDYQKEIIKIKASKNLFWSGLPMERVIKHFEVLTTRNSKNGNQFLSTKQLVSFLKRGFLRDMSQPKLLINCTRGEKGFVIKLFYEFFDLAVSEYGYPTKKEKFINLFTECFDNWDLKTVTHFFKPNKTRENW